MSQTANTAGANWTTGNSDHLITRYSNGAAFSFVDFSHADPAISTGTRRCALRTDRRRLDQDKFPPQFVRFLWRWAVVLRNRPPLSSLRDSLRKLEIEVRGRDHRVLL